MASHTSYSKDFLEPFRKQGDPLADEVISKIMEAEDMGALRDLFTTLASNDLSAAGSYDIFNHKIRDDVKAYFEETHKLPDWADPERFESAISIFEAYGPEVLMTLVAYSLPFCYSCANGAEVLYQTGRLMKHDGNLGEINRRLIETSQFVINLLSDHTLTSDKKDGIVSIQKVRLIHATIRYHITATNKHFSEDPDYDVEKFGVPINQEDLAGTMLSFGVVIVRGLDKLGIHLSDQQKEDFIHYWAIIGSMLGIKDELIPKSYIEASDLADAIYAHQAATSEAGTQLTNACIEFMDSHVKQKKLKHVPLALVYFFGGDDMARLLKLPPLDDKLKVISSSFFREFEKIQEATEKHFFLRHVGAMFSRHLVEGFLHLYNKGKRVEFHLPASLSDNGRPLEVRKNLPVGEQLGTIDRAIKHLVEVTDYFKSENNPMGLFAAIYLLSTRRVAAGLANNEFEQAEVMHQVDVAFVSRYFEALNHYFNQTTPTEPWAIAFKGCAEKGLFVDQYIFVAANAHIDFDLGIAVASVCPGEKIYNFQKDFYHMNDVFSGMYNQMNLDVAEIWKPFGWLMKVAGNLIRKTEGSFMVKGRTLAWERARKIALSSGKDYQTVISELEDTSRKVGEVILYPNFLANKLLRFMAKQERGTVADKIDAMLRTENLKAIN